MRNIIFFTCFTILALISSVGMLSVGYLFEYKSKNKIKSFIYECGVSNIDVYDLKIRTNNFNYLIMFLIFEISSIFLYPVVTMYQLNSAKYAGIIFTYLFLILLIFLLSIKYRLVGGDNE